MTKRLRASTQELVTQDVAMQSSAPTSSDTQKTHPHATVRSQHQTEPKQHAGKCLLDDFLPDAPAIVEKFDISPEEVAEFCARASNDPGPLRHLRYAKAERQLAGIAREIAMDRDVLYHGTRYPKLVLETGVLLQAVSGDQKVCLTRSPEVAAYWALLERDDDEACGAILVLDRPSLERRYELVPVPEPYWHTNKRFHDEAEEEIWGNVTDVPTHLLGVVRTSKKRGVRRMPDRKRRTKLNRIYRRLIGGRILNLFDGDRKKGKQLPTPSP